MATNKNINTASATVDTIIDTAFVPDMQEKTPKTAEEKQSAFFASLAGKKVTAPVFAKPENGVHSVVIHEIEYKPGRNGREDYFAMKLKDVKKNIIWDFALSATAEAVMGFLNEVNMYSNGVVMYKEPEEALSILRKRSFNVWTLQYKDQHGVDRVKSYSNPDGYEKFSRYISYHSAETKKAEEAYRAHKESEKKEEK